MSQAGRVALVTGGTRGIGRATARQLGREGADLVVNYARDEAAAAETVAELEAMGRRALAVKADIGTAGGVAHLVGEALGAFGRVDLLVHNAGAGGRIALIPDTTDEDWQRMIDVNARAALQLARELLPRMLEQRFGRIVNVSSLTAKTAKGYWSASPLGAKSGYAAAKAALIGFTAGLALEGAPHVTANAVCPGLVDKGNFRTPEQLAVKARAIGDIPLGRLATPEDVASVICFLLSDGASYVTGQTINVAGGLLMQ